MPLSGALNCLAAQAGLLVFVYAALMCQYWPLFNVACAPGLVQTLPVFQGVLDSACVSTYVTEREKCRKQQYKTLSYNKIVQRM